MTYLVFVVAYPLFLKDSPFVIIFFVLDEYPLLSKSFDGFDFEKVSIWILYLQTHNTWSIQPLNLSI